PDALPICSLPNVRSRFEDVDLVVVRENTEDLYSAIEHEVVPGVVESLKIITEKGSRRIAEFAFEYARRHGRQRITALHKANIMKMSDGLFLNCAREVAGRNLAKPTAMILSAAMMLDYLGESDAASRLRQAVEAVLTDGRSVTRDLGGEASTNEMAEAIAAKLGGVGR